MKFLGDRKKKIGLCNIYLNYYFLNITVHYWPFKMLTSKKKKTKDVTNDLKPLKKCIIIGDFN